METTGLYAPDTHVTLKIALPLSSGVEPTECPKNVGLDTRIRVVAFWGTQSAKAPDTRHTDSRASMEQRRRARRNVVQNRSLDTRIMRARVLGVLGGIASALSPDKEGA